MSKHKKPKKELNKELQVIYAEKDGEIPDLSKLERREDAKFTRLLIKLIAGLSVIALVSWAGFLVWSGSIFQDNEVLVTSIDGPSEVRAGEEVFYTLRYGNPTDTPIASLEMKVNLPFGFELTSSSPEPTQEQTWTIGSVTPGSDGSIILGGTFRTEVPSTQSLQAFFTYRPANFSSDFQDIQTQTIDVTDSVITVVLSGPEKALPGDEVIFVVNAQNTGREPVHDIEIAVDLPNDFQLSSSDPSIEESAPAAWTFDLLEPGELVAITLIGQFTSSATGEQTMQANAFFVDPQGTRLSQANNDLSTDILGGGVMFSLIVDGSTTDITSDLGNRLRISIDYANNGEDTVEGFALSLDLVNDDGKAIPINWDEASISNGIRSGSTIVWDETSVETFGTFAPGTTGVLDLTLPILDSITTEADAFTLALTGTMQKIGNVASPRSIDASPIDVRINSDFETTTIARYYTTDGEALGSGPLPPRSDDTTSYRIFWTLTNTLHTLEEVTLSTTLPANVSWKDRKGSDIGELSYNDVTRIVTWKIDKLPDDVLSVEGWFEVAISPNVSDVGSFFKLTNATSYFAKDPISGGDISGALDFITTELSLDEFAAGKGVVVE